uniref:Mind bomb SH3 repeat domain-containing protein n=1 Tax=Biomphalaria glabrata TaxID=6526 RepID=A0A2C9KKJ0_BIOGL
MVQWTGPSHKPVAHRLGHKGKMDLKFSKPVDGGHYYKSHLALLGKREKVPQKFKVGDKVNIIIDVEAVKRMQEDHGGWNEGMIKVTSLTFTFILSTGPALDIGEQGRRL